MDICVCSKALLNKIVSNDAHRIAQMMRVGPFKPVRVRTRASQRWRLLLTDAGINPPVGSAGDSYDNALAETINGLFKAEVIYGRGPWQSFEPVEFATSKLAGGLNNRCLLGLIGNTPPAETKANFYAALVTPVMAAQLTKNLSSANPARFIVLLQGYSFVLHPT